MILRSRFGSWLLALQEFPRVGFDVRMDKTDCLQDRPGDATIVEGDKCQHVGLICLAMSRSVAILQVDLITDLKKVHLC